MPKSFFFKPDVDTQSLPLALQQAILKYLPVEDVAFMANTSHTLQQAIMSSEPLPGMKLQQNLQLFKERRAILLGYRLLQQSTLPAWLKDRWNVKINMLVAISQGLIHVDVDPATAVAKRVKPIADALVLTEAWPDWIIEIHRNDQDLVAEPTVAFDTLSLQDLRVNYDLQLRCNSNKSFLNENQSSVLALLEISEIFLSCADSQMAIAGLQALYRDFMGDRQIISLFTDDKDLLNTRNAILRGPAKRTDSDDEDRASSERTGSDDEESAAFDANDNPDAAKWLARANFQLSAPVLLAIGEGCFTVKDMKNYYNDTLLAALVVPNGISAMKQGFLCFRHVKRANYEMTIEHQLTVVQFLLSDTCLAAFAKGLINQGKAIFKFFSKFDLDEEVGLIVSLKWARLSIDSKTLLTPHGESVATACGLDLEASLSLLSWEPLLVRMNEYLVKAQLTQASAPTLSR